MGNERKDKYIMLKSQHFGIKIRNANSYIHILDSQMMAQYKRHDAAYKINVANLEAGGTDSYSSNIGSFHSGLKLDHHAGRGLQWQLYNNVIRNISTLPTPQWYSKISCCLLFWPL